MDMEMRSLRQRYSIIHARRELINFGLKVDESAISVVQKDDMAMFLWPRNKYEKNDTFLQPLANHVGETSQFRINLCFPVGGYYDNIESFLDSPSRPDHFISIDPVGSHIQKSGAYLAAYSRGYYGELSDAPKRLISYANEHSLGIFGPVYVVYLYDEFCTKDPSQYLAQSYVAIRE